MTTIEEMRPKWWTLCVAIMYILVPAVWAVIWFIIPDTSILNGDSIPDEHQSNMFHLEVRSDACGTALAVVVVAYQITTKHWSVLKATTIMALIWIALEFLAVIVDRVITGEFSCLLLAFSCIVDLVLQLFMFIKLGTIKDDDMHMGESSPLII